MRSTVTIRGQTAIPAEIRRKYNIKPGTRLEWIDDGRTITVIPVPEDPVKALRGKIKEPDLCKALIEARQEERNRG